MRKNREDENIIKMINLSDVKCTPLSKVSTATKGSKSLSPRKTTAAKKTQAVALNSYVNQSLMNYNF